MSEKDGTVAVTVKRTGNLNQYAIVLCRTEQGTATSTSSTGSRAGQQDYVEYAGQVGFNVFYVIISVFLYNTQYLIKSTTFKCSLMWFLRFSLMREKTPRCAPL